MRDAEQMETQHWVTEARDCGYISETDAGQNELRTRRSRADVEFDDGKGGFLLGPPDSILREPATQISPMIEVARLLITPSTLLMTPLATIHVVDDDAHVWRY